MTILLKSKDLIMGIVKKNNRRNTLVGRRKDYELTPFMIDLLKDFYEFVKTHPDSTMDVLAKYWDVTEASASQRLTQFRKCGYKDAQLRRRRKSEYKFRGVGKRGRKELNIDGEIEAAEMIYDYDTVRNADVGDSSLPICENCEKLGRTTTNGEKPHYVMEIMDGEEVMWCESCGYEPGAKKLILELQSVDEQRLFRISHKILGYTIEVYK